jgi:hypothetical protein
VRRSPRAGAVFRFAEGDSLDGKAPRFFCGAPCFGELCDFGFDGGRDLGAAFRRLPACGRRPLI